MLTLLSLSALLISLLLLLLITITVNALTLVVIDIILDIIIGIIAKVMIVFSSIAIIMIILIIIIVNSIINITIKTITRGRAGVGYIPQAFDVEPYINRADGRRIKVHGGWEGWITRGRDDTKKSNGESYGERGSRDVIGEKVNMKGKGGLIYDPLVNNFDVAKDALKKELLLCEQCTRGLRMIVCKTCAKAFCFQCAFKVRVMG